MKIKSMGDFLAATIVICLMIVNHTVKAADSAPVNVCYEEWPPFIETTENGKIEGLVVPFLEKLQDNLSMEMKLISLPYIRCLKGIQAGSYDAILMDDNTEGLRSSRFLTAYWELSLLTRKGEFKNVEEFLSYPQGHVTFSFEYEYPPRILKLFQGRWERGNTTPENIENWLRHQRVDAIVEDTNWFKELMLDHAWDDFEVLTPPIYFINQHMNIHPRRKDFIDEVNAIVEAEQMEEEITKLFKAD